MLNLPCSKFTLHPSLAFSYIGSVTAQHSCNGRQPNFAALSRGRHLYWAGRPSSWALAHILVCYRKDTLPHSSVLNDLGVSVGAIHQRKIGRAVD